VEEEGKKMRTLGTTHVDTSQGILEDLLKAQKLEDGQVDGWMETETTLVGTEGGVELDTVASVDVGFALVVLPDDTELHDALGDLEERGVSMISWRAEIDGEGGLEIRRGRGTRTKVVELTSKAHLNDLESTLVLGVLGEEGSDSDGKLVAGLFKLWLSGEDHDCQRLVF
jgi:hypothetical protein